LRVTVLKALLTLIKAIKVDADADAVAFNLRGGEAPMPSAEYET
jgi:hypothetical protein